jgi:hypothetical protein
MNIRRAVILVAGLIAFGVWTTPAPGGASNYGNQQLATQCVIQPTSGGSMITARTSWRIWSSHESPEDYRWKARLIPADPGLIVLRRWTEVETSGVGTVVPTSYDATLETPPASSSEDWDLEVKLTWDRPDRQDWNVEHVLEFDERACVAA